MSRVESSRVESSRVESSEPQHRTSSQLTLLNKQTNTQQIVRSVGNSLAGSLGSPANAKNVISVGATESYGNDIMSSQRGINYIADFSSRGPTADGRTKPDLLAPGFSILSASGIHSQTAECDPTSKPDAPNGDVQGLKFMAGTSMATPVMSGTAALVRQYFSDGYYPTGGKVGANALNPKASLVKAVLLNSGQPMDGSNNQGGQGTTDTAMYDSNENFGRVNLLKTLRLSGQVSKRSERALRKTRIFVMNPAKWLQTAISITELTYSTIVARSLHSCFVENCAEHNIHLCGV